jgi:hypothetical protein
MRTRSPALAIKDFPNYPATMLIEPAPATADSTHAALVLDLHEGSDMTILFQSGTSATSLPVRISLGEDATSYELAYQVSATDTVLYFVKRDRQQRELSRFAYRRVAQVKPGKEHITQLNDEFAHTLNRLLLAGTYLGTDSLGRRVQAQFWPDGQVKGLPFRTYHILEDFLGGPTGGDVLICNMYQKDQQQFVTDYGRDTLRLYEQYEAIDIPPGGMDSTLISKRGRLRYQLIRRKRP